MGEVAKTTSENEGFPSLTRQVDAARTPPMSWATSSPAVRAPRFVCTDIGWCVFCCTRDIFGKVDCRRMEKHVTNLGWEGRRARVRLLQVEMMDLRDIDWYD